MVVVLVSACRSQPDPSPQASTTPQPAIERPTVELVGCRHLEAGACFLRAGTDEALSLWLDLHVRAGVQVSVDGESVVAERVAVDGGQRLHVKVSERAEELAIVGVDPPWTEPYELRLVHEAVPAVVAEAEAQAQAEEGSERLRAALPELDGSARLAALQSLRRLLAGVDRSAALARTEEAAELAGRLGRIRDLADCAAAAAGMAVIAADLPAARRWTRTLEQVADELPEARVWSRYYGGVLAAQTGDLGGSVRALGEACRLAERLGMSRMLLSAREQLATVLAELGRDDEARVVAREILAQIAEPGVTCSDRARATGNVAWIHMLLAEAGHAHDPPRPLLEQQLAAVSEGGECPDPFHAAFVNLALVALAEHEPEEAWAWITAQQLAGVPSYLRAWVEEITTQVGLATGREALVPALVRRPDPGGADPSLRWMALLRHARSLDALGLRAVAIDSYLAAEAVLEETFYTVGAGFGGELFLAGRRASAEELVELLVQGGAVEHAFCRARLARGRALRFVDRAARIAGLSPEQRARREELLFEFLTVQDALANERRDDWKYSAPEREHRERRREEQEAEAAKLLDEALRIVGGPKGPSRCEELSASPAGAITILQFPRPEGAGSWIFVADDEGVDVRPAPGASGPDGADAWGPEALAGFAERIAGARLIRVMPTGSGWRQPIHALPVVDGVLLDVAPVVYSLDLPARAPRADPAANAVVVANPSDDLPYAREEAGEVVRRLSEAGWTVADHVEHQATRARLTEALGEAALLHYAGHGTHEGVDGWGAALLLHDGDRLTVADILALPRVPDAVVLSGCDTATVDETTIAGGMNLGRAFVLAGASWVIAADDRVDDELARAIGGALYELAEPLAGTGHFDGPEALRRAQLRLRREYPDRWQAFRVIVR
jgi:hypothetical protein